MAAKLIGDGSIGAGPLAAMRERGGQWAAYENHDLGHRDVGRLAFLQYGTGRTHDTPPPQYPDTEDVGFGWRYVQVGFVDLNSGRVVDVESSRPSL